MRRALEHAGKALDVNGIRSYFSAKLTEKKIGTLPKMTRAKKHPNTVKNKAN